MITPLQKLNTTPFPLPVKRVCDRAEFVTEGDLSIVFDSGRGVLLIDGCYLAEFIQRHFHAKAVDGEVEIGRVQIIISPVNE